MQPGNIAFLVDVPRALAHDKRDLLRIPHAWIEDSNGLAQGVCNARVLIRKAMPSLMSTQPGSQIASQNLFMTLLHLTCICLLH